MEIIHNRINDTSIYNNCDRVFTTAFANYCDPIRRQNNLFQTKER